MKKIILFMLSLFSFCIGYAQVVNPLDSMRQQFDLDITQMRAEFEAYEKQARADYEHFVQSVKSVWGADTVVVNTKKVWVEYGKDFKSRSIVDFENGGIQVEIAVDESEKQDTSVMNNRLADAVEQMLNSRGSTRPYSTSVDASAPLTEKPILDGLVDLSEFDMETSHDVPDVLIKNTASVPPSPIVKGKVLDIRKRSEANKNKKEDTHKESSNKTLKDKRRESREKATRKANSLKDMINKSALVSRIVALSKKSIKKTKGTDGKTRQIVQIQMSLVSDNLSRNAALYKDLVAEFSEKFQIEQPLIYAIMEQESAFNPQAVSPMGAIGLMQLVPKSGGADAYYYVYHKKWDKEPDYLYVPRNNIELGTAYLRVLMNQFDSVSDPHCRRLCVIAGYNTGAGNVSIAFIGNRKLGRAFFEKVESYDYNGLYNYLITNLPYSETRNYVVKVTQRREKYLKK